MYCNTIQMINNYEIDNVKKIYEIIADEFNKTRGYYWEPISNFMKIIDNNSLICDIGCGNGRNMSYEQHKFIGVDNCNKFINICNKKGLNAVYSDMTNINLPCNYFDHIICIASFHHLSTVKSRIASLLEMKRLLKPNGKILLTVWSKNQPKKTRVTFDNYGDNIVLWKKKFPRYYYIFELDELKNLFNYTGFKIISHTYDCGNEVFILSI